LKLYFSNTILDVLELVSFLNLPSVQIVLISAKITLNTNSDEEATVLLDKLLLSNVDMDNELQNIVIREIFLNFDQILRFTTINLWLHYQEKEKQTTAAFNLESKMMALESANASELTAMAIAKATEKIDNDHSLNLNASLRLSNLEKAVRRQEQKSNEARNLNKRTKTQKNSHGSYTLEQITLSDRSAPLLDKTLIVDLTLTQDKPEKENTHRIQDKQRHPVTRTKNTKRQKRFHHPMDSSRKAVQWKTSELRNFNPDTPVTSDFQAQDNQTTLTKDTRATGLLHPYQFPTPQPLSFGSPLDNPFHQGQHQQRLTHQPIQFLHGHIQNPYYTPQTHIQNPFHNQSHPINNPFTSQHKKRN
jgi:hypothetical protein